MARHKGFFWDAAFIALGLTLSSFATFSQVSAAAPPEGLRRILEAARSEGQVNYVSSGDGPELTREYNERFNKKFGLNVTIKNLPISSSKGVARLLQEKAANRLTMDVLHPSYTLTFGLIGKGIILDFDWIGVFGQILPGMDKVATRVPDVLKKKALDFQHLVYIPLYNTNLVAKRDVPKKWEDLTAPRWKGRKIMMDSRGTSTYLLSLEYGDQWTLDFSSKLAQQAPLFGAGVPAIAKAVARGEAPLGITTLSNILELKQQGMPVDVAPMEVVPIVPQVVIAVDGSPYANAGRLFAAWVATEGLELAEKTDFSGRAWPGSGSIQATLLEKAGSKVILASNPEQVEAVAKLLPKIQRIMQRSK